MFALAHFRRNERGTFDPISLADFARASAQLTNRAMGLPSADPKDLVLDRVAPDYFVVRREDGTEVGARRTLDAARSFAGAIAQREGRWGFRVDLNPTTRRPEWRPESLESCCIHAAAQRDLPEFEMACVRWMLRNAAAAERAGRRDDAEEWGALAADKLEEALS